MVLSLKRSDTKQFVNAGMRDLPSAAKQPDYMRMRKFLTPGPLSPRDGRCKDNIAGGAARDRKFGGESTESDP